MKTEVKTEKQRELQMLSQLGLLRYALEKPEMKTITKLSDNDNDNGNKKKGKKKVVKKGKGVKKGGKGGKKGGKGKKN